MSKRAYRWRIRCQGRVGKRNKKEQMPATAYKGRLRLLVPSLCDLWIPRNASRRVAPRRLHRLVHPTQSERPSSVPRPRQRVQAARLRDAERASVLCRRPLSCGQVRMRYVCAPSGTFIGSNFCDLRAAYHASTAKTFNCTRTLRTFSNLNLGSILADSTFTTRLPRHTSVVHHTTRVRFAYVHSIGSIERARLECVAASFLYKAMSRGLPVNETIKTFDRRVQTTTTLCVGSTLQQWSRATPSL